jgi:hypothetical protein
LSIFFTVVFIVGCLILISSYCDANKNELKAKYTFLTIPFLNSSLGFVENSVCPTIEKVSKNIPIEKIDALLQSLEIFDFFSSLFNFF